MKLGGMMTKHQGERDTLVTEESPVAPAGSEAALLQRALIAVHTGDDSPEGGFDELTDTMRRAGQAVVDAAAAWIETCRKSDPMLAWSLLYVLDRSEVAEAVDLYTREALRPIVRADEGGCYSEADVDELVAAEACEALSRRAAAGDGRATERLLSIVTSPPSRAVRVTAARATYAALPKTRERLEELLGDEAGCLRWDVVPAEQLGVETDDERERPDDRPAGRVLLPPPGPDGEAPRDVGTQPVSPRLRPLRRRGESPSIDKKRG